MTTETYTEAVAGLPQTAAAAGSRKALARRAGLLWALAGITTPFALLYVPSRILVAGDAAATAQRIRESAGLVRMAAAAELWSGILVIFVALALYRLFREVDGKLAAAMMALILVAIPIQLLSVVFTLGSLMVTTSTTALQPFSNEQLDTLAFLLYRLHGRGLEVAQVFWGLWLFPWGTLAIRSGFIPKWVGASLFVAGFGYILASAVAITAPQLAGTVTPAALALGVGEIPMLFWLLIWGARGDA